MAEVTPMMKQYLELRDKYKDCILFYRLGDFYELFYDQAELCSRELELTLTGKDCGQEQRAPMCGIPFHAINTYIPKAPSPNINAILKNVPRLTIYLLSPIL